MPEQRNDLLRVVIVSTRRCMASRVKPTACGGGGAEVERRQTNAPKRTQRCLRGDVMLAFAPWRRKGGVRVHSNSRPSFLNRREGLWWVRKRPAATPSQALLLCGGERGLGYSSQRRHVALRKRRMHVLRFHGLHVHLRHIGHVLVPAVRDCGSGEGEGAARRVGVRFGEGMRVNGEGKGTMVGRRWVAKEVVAARELLLLLIGLMVKRRCGASVLRPPMLLRVSHYIARRTVKGICREIGIGVCRRSRKDLERI